jgi:hypothetical protein
MFGFANGKYRIIAGLIMAFCAFSITPENDVWGFSLRIIFFLRYCIWHNA